MLDNIDTLKDTLDALNRDIDKIMRVIRTPEGAQSRPVKKFMDDLGAAEKLCNTIQDLLYNKWQPAIDKGLKDKSIKSNKTLVREIETLKNCILALYGMSNPYHFRNLKDNLAEPRVV